MKHGPDKSKNPRPQKRAKTVENTASTDESENTEGPISQLPNEILADIFSFVQGSEENPPSQLQEVCRTWHSVYNYLLSQQMNQKIGPVTLYRADGFFNKLMGWTQGSQHRITSEEGKVALFEEQERKIQHFRRNIKAILNPTNHDAVTEAYLNLVLDAPAGISSELLTKREKGLNYLNECILRDKISSAKLGDHLNCSECYLTDFPESVISDPILADFWQNVSFLDLRNNHLKKLPSNIGKLTMLRCLVLDNNELTSLPDSLVELNALTLLRLSDNKFTVFPEVICSLSNLECLHINNNQITELPVNIENLTMLDMLLLKDNLLTVLPDCLSRLLKLNDLDVRYNWLRSIPQGLDKRWHHDIATNEDVLATQRMTIKERISNIFGL